VFYFEQIHVHFFHSALYPLPSDPSQRLWFVLDSGALQIYLLTHFYLCRTDNSATLRCSQVSKDVFSTVLQVFCKRYAVWVLYVGLGLCVAVKADGVQFTSKITVGRPATSPAYRAVITSVHWAGSSTVSRRSSAQCLLLGLSLIHGTTQTINQSINQSNKQTKNNVMNFDPNDITDPVGL